MWCWLASDLIYGTTPSYGREVWETAQRRSGWMQGAGRMDGPSLGEVVGWMWRETLPGSVSGPSGCWAVFWV